MTRVMMVGSAEKSGGGVASVLRTMKSMPFWQEYSCYWLGTQIQRNCLWKLWYAVRAYLVAVLKIREYDIIHFHTVPDRICLAVQMPVLLLALLGRKKIVTHIHMGNQLEDHTRNRLFLWVLGKSDIVILLARQWERLFREKFPGIHVPTAVVYNACREVGDVPPEEKGKSIIMAAYLNDNKAPDLLLKAWSRIKDRYPEWRITIMGNGEVGRFRQMAHDMGLDSCIDFTGYVTGEEKERIWRKASIYCMCSYNEGFPMVVLEAWAYGIAVVTTPVGGLPDVIEDGRNCVTFPFGDSGSLAERLAEIIEDERMRSDIAGYGRDFVRKNFLPENTDREIRRIYSQL